MLEREHAGLFARRDPLRHSVLVPPHRVLLLPVVPPDHGGGPTDRHKASAVAGPGRAGVQRTDPANQLAHYYRPNKGRATNVARQGLDGSALWPADVDDSPP